MINGELITITAGFRAYSSLYESAQDYVDLLLNGVDHDKNHYAPVWMENTTSYKDATAALQGKYATDPNYAERLDKYIEKYQLCQFDTPKGECPALDQ